MYIIETMEFGNIKKHYIPADKAITVFNQFKQKYSYIWLYDENYKLTMKYDFAAEVAAMMTA